MHFNMVSKPVYKLKGCAALVLNNFYSRPPSVIRFHRHFWRFQRHVCPHVCVCVCVVKLNSVAKAIKDNLLLVTHTHRKMQQASGWTRVRLNCLRGLRWKNKHGTAASAILSPFHTTICLEVLLQLASVSHKPQAPMLPMKMNAWTCVQIPKSTSLWTKCDRDFLLFYFLF